MVKLVGQKLDSGILCFCLLLSLIYTQKGTGRCEIPTLGKKSTSGLVEDKFCGMKNKNKSKKIQRQIQQMKMNKEALKKPRQKSKKELKEEKRKEYAQMFDVYQPPVPRGVNPKTIFCERHKLNLCLRGSKCRFAHDLNTVKKNYNATDHKQRFELEREIGLLEKMKQEAEERQDNQLVQSLKDEIKKMQRSLWTITGDLANTQDRRTNNTYRSMKDYSINEVVITEEEFMQWYQSEVGKKVAKRRRAAKERRGRGVLTGREHFLQIRARQRLAEEEFDDSDAEGYLGIEDFDTKLTLNETQISSSA